MTVAMAQGVSREPAGDASPASGLHAPRIVFAFPGQGSQRSGMAARLLQAYPETVRLADDVLGLSLAELCAGKDGRLAQTQFTQPAMFVINALHCRELVERFGSGPSCALGHSLGEYNALHAAGVFDFETGLRIVKKRGELMSRCPAGRMAALVGDRSNLLSFLSQNADGVDLANDNSPRQIVVAGSPQAIAAMEEQMQERALGQVIQLPVSGAFHSRLMQRAMAEFSEFLSRQTLRAPKFDVIANVSASPHTLEQMIDRLADHLVSPVRWLESIHLLLRRGPMLFQEAGPGRVLSNLFREIVAQAPCSIGGWQ
ncbi:ACP S-malonyltransferase [Bradyrhizobium elkanii]|uniref:ACP S-malonyltransferase n=1 Tax=Bradyrhizobium elkanii TaxID=29448 RepID=UPI001BAA6D3A|nr:ACP S-malonyltransferase [Bradyrhizobium elkanii]MBR1158098.1 ACP S-malonyltransferase [Bradyrhizobium elkanii]